MPEPTPRFIIRQQRRDLGERQDEDEIEEELEQSNSMLGLGALVAHSRTVRDRTVPASALLATPAGVRS